MRVHVTTFFGAASIVALGGCFVIDEGHLRGLADATTDASTDAPAALALVEDRCGVMRPRAVLTQSTYGIAIDTRAMSNDVVSSCGGVSTDGNDAFIAVDVQPGVYWHFHLRNDATDAQSAGRHPALFMLHAPSGSCDPRDCRFTSDACDDAEDEHFGFVADAAGLWYLGIDDRMQGGARYQLDAIRPICGDDAKDHGEACDDGNVVDGDGCNAQCLRELTAEAPNEIEPNDNPTEANFVRMVANQDFVITGSIGGDGACRYSDTFAIDVPPTATVTVSARQPSGAACADAALTEGYQLALRNAAFTDVVSGDVDSSGCATIGTGTLAGGRYYVTVLAPVELERPVRYRLNVHVGGGQ